MGRLKQSSTAAMLAARRTRRLALEERNLLLLAWITDAKLTAHLEPPQRPDLLFPAVLCVHTAAGQLVWRLTDDEIPDFSHLPTHPASHYDGASALEKRDRLRTLGRPANVAPRPMVAILEALSATVPTFGPKELGSLERCVEQELAGKATAGIYAVFLAPTGDGARLDRYRPKVHDHLPLDRLQRPMDPRSGWLYAGTLTKA